MKNKITIRISDSLRTKLSEKSEAENTSVSEVARTILENYFSSNPSLEVQSNINESAKTIQEVTRVNQIVATTNLKEEDVVFSSEFYKLLIWMYDQKESRILKLSNTQIESFKEFIIKIQCSNEISKELKNEFDKVYIDLINLINKKFKSYLRPDFALGGSEGFNYEMLGEFLFPEEFVIDLLIL